MEAASANQAKWRFNPFTQSYYQNPYPLLRRLREEDPVHWSFFNMWLVTRYADVVELLRERVRFSADHVESWDGYKEYRRAAGDQSAFLKVEKGFLVFNEASTHARFRAAMKGSFTPATFQHLRPLIQETVESLLNKEPGTEIEVIEELAQPLASRTLCEVLGVSPEQGATLHTWALAYNMAIEPIAGVAVLAAADRATEEMKQLYQALQTQPGVSGTNLARTLQQAQAQGLINFDEGFALWATIVLAGSATTINAIGNGLLGLLRHPEQIGRLRADPALTKNAVHELLRYDTPGMIVTRAATSDTELGGKKIRKGELIMAFLGAANRDPEMFEDPDALIVDRKNASQHLAFGEGVHFCIGEQIAKIELETVVRTLVKRFPDAQLASEQVQWVSKVHWHGLRSLSVRL